MTFTNPTALLLGLLAIPVLALYAWRVRACRYRVATGFLWQQAVSASPLRAAWRRWRRLVSLGLTMAVLGLLVLASADPHVPPPRCLVLVVDNSASMNATDVEPSRLGVAKQRALDLIAGLGYGERLAIVCAGGPVHVGCRATGDPQTLRAALEAIPATRGPTRVDAAVVLGRRILGESPRGRVVVLSDGGFEGAAELAGADDVDLVLIGRRCDNLAVTRLVPRRTPADPRRCQVLVAVSSFSDQPVDCRVDLELDGKPLESVPVELAPAARWQRVFELTTAEAGVLVARLDRNDDLSEDNQATARFASAPARPVAQVTGGSPCPYLEKALVAESDLRVPKLEEPEAGLPALVPARRPLWMVLGAVAVLLLVTEWGLYQRRWVS